MNNNKNAYTLITAGFQYRDMFHLLHLQTSSFAAHDALGTLYDEYLDKLDELIECYQGKYGKITLPAAVMIQLEESSSMNPTTIIRQAYSYFSSDIYKMAILTDRDTDLKQIADDILNILNRAAYRLTLS